MDFLGFFLAYAIKIPIIPFHTWQAKVYQKAPTVGTMLLSGIMLKMGLYSIIRWQLPIAPLAAKEYMLIFIALGIAGVIYGSIVALRQKDLKKLLAYSSLLTLVNCSWNFTLTLDGLRGAVLQMIAHGFVVLDYSLLPKLFSEDMKLEKLPKWEAFVLNHQSLLLFMILVLASVALPGTLTLLENLPFYIAFLKLIFGLHFRWNNNYFRSLLYVENVPKCNVRRNKYQNFLQM
jgi:NADH-quinone oxidoreductase subunit M